MNKLDKIEKKYLKTDIPEFKAGDKIKVKIKISEENKDRIQVFEGVILAVKKPKTPSGTILVRKISHNNIGVEKIYPLHSPYHLFLRKKYF